MTVLMGPSCSGKDTIVHVLINDYEFERPLSYTTRTPRPGEVDGKDYYFRTEEEFLNKVKAGFFAEWKSYEVEGKVLYYGTAKSAFTNASKKTLMILTPAGVIDLRKAGYSLTVVYISAPNHVRLARAHQRGDSPESIELRLERDYNDFLGAECLADVNIVNDGSCTVKDIAADIVKELQLD